MNGSHRGSQERLERVRQWRAREHLPAAIEEEMKLLQRRVERTGRRISEFISLWEEFLPRHLVASTRVRGVRGGVFHVSVETSPALFEIDRLLREGGLAAIRGRLSGTLVRIKLAVEPLNDPDLERQ